MLGFKAVETISKNPKLEASWYDKRLWFTFTEMEKENKPNFKELNNDTWEVRERKPKKPKKPKKVIRGSGRVKFNEESLENLPADMEIRIFVEDNSCSNSDGHYEVYTRDGMDIEPE